MQHSFLVIFRTFSFVFLGIFYFLPAHHIFAQQTYSSSSIVQKIRKSKRIGLVLGGGGARGLAHVGVIKALEEYGIKPQVIGGTSMGAIVGSVYSMGYSVAEMDSVFSSIDYDDIFFRSYKKRYPSIFLKEIESNSLIHIDMKKFTPHIPTFYTSSLPMVHLYNRLMINKGKYDDFSQLTKEFYCIGTDVYARKSVIFTKGEVIKSVLASSAFPFVFSPQFKDNAYYIDGGVLDNFPIDAMEDKKVDVIIGIDVRDLTVSPNTNTQKDIKFSSIVDALFGSFEDSTMDEKIKKCDIYLHPDVNGIFTLDFSHPKDIIKLGYTKMSMLLDSLGFSKMDPNRGKKAKKSNYLEKFFFSNSTEIPLKKVDYFFQDSIDNVYKKQMASFFRLNPNQINTYTLDKIIHSVEDIYNTGMYRSISYDFKKTKPSDSGYILHVFSDPKNIDYSLLASASYTNQFGTEFMLGISTKNFLVHNSYLSFQFMFGSAPRYNLNYYLDRGLVPSIGFSSKYYFYTFVNRFDEEFLNKPTTIYPVFGQYNFRNRIYIKSNINRIFGLEIGAEYNLVTTRQTSTFSISDDALLYGEVNQFNVYADILYDKLNDKIFPSKGIYLRGTAKLLDLQTKVETYTYSLDIDAIGAFPISKKISLLSRFRIASIFNFEGNVTTLNFFKLGGSFDYNIYSSMPLWGYDQVTRIFTKGYAYAGVGVNYEPFKKWHLMFNANIANVMLRQSSLFADFDKFKYLPYGVGLVIGYDSSIAPFLFGAQYSKEDGFGLVFRLGYVY